MAERPSGTVTFLFTDIEGSTQAWENDPTAMAADLEIHDRILGETIESNGGFVFATGGDSFSAAFGSSTEALTAAAEAQRQLDSSECGLRVRMGVHSGEAVERDGNYFGPALNRTARLMSIGHGGQVLVSATTRELVTIGDFEFEDLGEHRLADLSTPTRVVQLVADNLGLHFPPLRSVVATDNLPRLGAVFGRESAIENLREMLGDHRLVTLTGAGGIGKTTLATSVAAQIIEPFPDGRWLVDLTDLPPGSEYTAILGAVAGVDDRFGSIEALAPRQMLLVLDNCEHVLDGVSSYLSGLLDTAPDVTVLVTSREPIGIRGERVLPIEPLSVDDDSEHASAVNLFITRATEAGVTLDLDAERDTIAAICTEVGGLPLAIELAAARTAVMTPGQVLDRLGDRLSVLRGGRGGPEHHRTIEATIAWSYDLLDEDTQKLLRFLPVFEGGFDLEQAEAIGGDRAVDRLTDLVRKSLVHRDYDRFDMLEAVRQYATARLREVGDEGEAQRRHFEFFADWAHGLYHRDRFIDLTSDELTWTTANLQSLRSAIIWGAANERRTLAAEIAAVLWRHQIVVLLGKPTPPDYFEPLLTDLDALDPALQMAMLYGSGAIAHWSDRPQESKQRTAAAYEIHRQFGLIPRTASQPQVALGIEAYLEGEWDMAERWFREAIAFAQENDLPHYSASDNLAELLMDIRRDPKEALTVVQEAWSRNEEAPMSVRYAGMLSEADARIRLGETEEPRRLVAEALQNLRQYGVMVYQQGWSLVLLSILEYRERNIDAAITLLLECLELEEAEGTWPVWQHHEALYVAELLIELGHYDTADRVLDAYQASSLGAMQAPAHTPTLTALRERIHDHLQPEQRVDNRSDTVPLVMAIRHALETATR